ncbi:MAG: 2Fe-2S iron-sulfur cluster binding domain-containing protein [Proteobacteria bacterium]|nr:2Fe-2S iron-sulfur cluster binding domain-containing protein [Pseudomonadota bacterium]
MAKKYTATYILANGERKTVQGDAGDNLLELAHQHGIPLEGACECALACSTCHVIVRENWFNKLSEATEKEEDLLDFAFGLTSTSRLGCQIVLGPDTDGIVVELPKATRNMMVDKDA